ncbi:selenide, water dikinase SelD [Okeania sp.]|uniref:selenide, water dikinase SelD n=1 Tax=Okeania sp. TaxID=3100323 RepID=UPI002B4B8578|nr:selenide, water dikinase SelD [Okeania sp.]MEB3341503.1 selenide, water dikinase SelD [Okeania sp.]
MKSSTPTEKDLVLIGGGHSHAIAIHKFAMNPIPGVRLTLLTDVYHTPYSGMLPGYVAGLYNFDQCHIDLRPLAKFASARIFVDRAIGLDLKKNQVFCANRPPVNFDLLSIDIGSTPASLTVPGATKYAIAVKPISKFLTYWHQITTMVSASPNQKIRIGIVGGGAGGVELAFSVQSHLHQIYRHAQQPTDNLKLHIFQRGTKLLPDRQRWVGKQVEKILRSRGVVLHLQENVGEVANSDFTREVPDTDLVSDAPMNSEKTKLKSERDLVTDVKINETPHFLYSTPKMVRCDSGLEVECDILFWVTQASATPWLQQAGLATDARGFILVNEKLQSISHPQVFAAGDVATMVNHARPKAGVFAVRQGKPLFENLHRALLGKPLKSFIPQKNFLILIGTGDEQAIASRGQIGFGPHRFLWRWKDNIDSKFIDRFSNLTMAAKTQKGENRMQCAGCGAKVGSRVLENVLHQISQKVKRADILMGIDNPDDAAVVRVPTDKVMVQTIDYFPALVDDPYLLGKITANHCLNDLFAMGATAQSGLAIATIPYATPTKQQDTLYELLLGATEVFNQAGAVLIGGHTTEGEELAFGLTCNGLASPEKLLYNRGMQPGDVLILTKPLGTGTLFAADMRLKARGRWIESAISSMLISNQNAAQLLLEYGATACTDVSGFGLVGHLGEMVKGQKVAVELELETIPVLPGVIETLAQGIFSSLYPENLQLFALIENQEEGSRHPLYPLLFDPQTSGGLLATIPAELASPCLKALQREYPESRMIGRVLLWESGMLPIKINTELSIKIVGADFKS